MVEFVVGLEWKDVFFRKLGIRSRCKAFVIENIVIIRDFFYPGTFIKRKNLFFEERPALFRNGNIENNFLTIMRNGNLDSEILFELILFTDGYRLKTGEKLFHSSQEILKAPILLFHWRKRDLK